MSFMVRTIPGTTALVLDSPHSGVVYPEDFRHACDLGVLRGAEDTHVEKLYEFAPELGVAWVEALFPRSYLDPNRNVTEIDPAMLEGEWPHEVETDEGVLSKVRLGKGLVWRYTDEGVPIYDRPLTAHEVRNRIEQCWKPYHDAVRGAIDAAFERHGYVIHLNCHSMPAVAASHATDFPGLVHKDFVVGDRDGTTAAPELSRRICRMLESFGHSAAYNHPYKGVELVRRYGDPARNRHSIQLEINRRLYMDEQTREPNAGFEPLRSNLRRLVTYLLETDPRQLH